MTTSSISGAWCPFGIATCDTETRIWQLCCSQQQKQGLSKFNLDGSPQKRQTPCGFFARAKFRPLRPPTVHNRLASQSKRVVGSQRLRADKYSSAECSWMLLRPQAGYYLLPPQVAVTFLCRGPGIPGVFHRGPKWTPRCKSVHGCRPKGTERWTGTALLLSVC